MGQPFAPSTIPSLTVGGQVFTDLKNLIMLSAKCGTNSYSTFRDARISTAAGYTVTAGKTLYVMAARIVVVTTVAASGPVLGYGDTDVGFNSVAAPTNPKFQSDTGGPTVIALGVGAIGTYECGFGPGFQVPAAKLPAVNYGGGFFSAYIFGYEK